MEDSGKGPPPRRARYGALAEASSLGFMFPLALGLGYLWGHWMDGLFGTGPWLAAIFTGFGLIAAFLNLFRLAAKADEEEKRAAGKNGE
jgi:F0F1-type ATP synthase assembly protein I